MPLCAYALAAVDGRLYLFGGYDGQYYVRKVYEYDPTLDRWSPKTPMSVARGFAAAAVAKGKVYVVGGYDGTSELALCEEYDPASEGQPGGPWVTRSSMASGRGGLGLTAVGSSLYAIGGGWNGYLAFNERYDVGTDTWARFSTPIADTWRNVGVISSGKKVYAIGGWSGEYLSVNEEYQALYVLFVPVSP